MRSSVSAEQRPAVAVGGCDDDDGAVLGQDRQAREARGGEGTGAELDRRTRL